MFSLQRHDQKALSSAEPPNYGPWPKRPSKLDPVRGAIEGRLVEDPKISVVRLREICTELGYEGGKSISTSSSARSAPATPSPAEPYSSNGMA